MVTHISLKAFPSFRLRKPLLIAVIYYNDLFSLCLLSRQDILKTGTATTSESYKKYTNALN